MLLVIAVSAFADPLATLPAKHAAALHRALAREPDAQRLLVPSTCAQHVQRAGVTVYACKKRGCRGACRVIEASAEVRVNASGMLAVRDVLVVDKGDTGECGCCM